MMPLCICGLKVDRLKSNLQCSICEQVFHLKCCSVSEIEFNFMKNQAFKCKACLVARRSSGILHTSPLPNAKNCASDNALKSISDLIVPVENYAGSSTDTDLTVNGSSVSASVACSVNLELIFAELIDIKKSNETLKTSNESLTALVSSLVNENSNLVSQVNELHCSINKLNDTINSIMVHASPKRKKNKLVKANVSSTAQNTVTIMPVSSQNVIHNSGSLGVELSPASPSIVELPSTQHAPSFATMVAGDVGVISNNVAREDNFQLVRNKKKKQPIVLGSNENKEYTDNGELMKRGVGDEDGGRCG